MQVAIVVHPVEAVVLVVVLIDDNLHDLCLDVLVQPSNLVPERCDDIVWPGANTPP